MSETAPSTDSCEQCPVSLPASALPPQRHGARLPTAPARMTVAGLPNLLSPDATRMNIDPGRRSLHSKISAVSDMDGQDGFSRSMNAKTSVISHAPHGESKALLEGALRSKLNRKSAHCELSSESRIFICPASGARLAPVENVEPDFVGNPDPCGSSDRTSCFPEQIDCASPPHMLQSRDGGSVARLSGGSDSPRNPRSPTQLNSISPARDFASTIMTRHTNTNVVMMDHDSSVGGVLPPVEEDEPANRCLTHFMFALTLGVCVGLVTVIFYCAAAKIRESHRYLAWLGACSFGEQGECSDSTVEMPRQGKAGLVFALLMMLGTTFGSVFAQFISYHIAPECAAGGTIATKICLAVGAVVPFRIGLWRFIVSSLYSGTSNVLGIEAPALHLAASVASTLHSSASCMGTRCGLFQKEAIFNDEGVPQAIVLGCAAGLSAAFGSPLAAASYAVEEYVDVRQTGTTTSLVLIAALCSSLMRRGFEPFAGSSSSTILTRQDSLASAGDATLSEDEALLPSLLIAILVAVLAGTLSPFVSNCVLRSRRFFNCRCSGHGELVVAACAGVMTSAVSWYMFTATGCESSWGVGILLTDTTCDGVSADGRYVGMSLRISLLLSVGKLASFIVSFAAGGSGGIQMPSLVLGSLLGRSVELVLRPVLGTLPNDAGALLGMTALFSANMRLPLTAAGIAVEYATSMSTSYSTSWACTLALSAALSTWVAAWWDPLNVFEHMMLQDGIDPFSLSQQIQVMINGPEASNAIPGPLARRESVASRISQILDVPAPSFDQDKRSSTKMVQSAQRRSTFHQHLTMGPTMGATLPRRSQDSVGSNPASIKSGPSILSATEGLLLAGHPKMKATCEAMNAEDELHPSLLSSVVPASSSTVGISRNPQQKNSEFGPSESSKASRRPSFSLFLAQEPQATSTSARIHSSILSTNGAKPSTAAQQNSRLKQKGSFWIGASPLVPSVASRRVSVAPVSCLAGRGASSDAAASSGELSSPGTRVYGLRHAQIKAARAAAMADDAAQSGGLVNELVRRASLTSSSSQAVEH